MGETLLKGYLQIKCANPGRIVRKVCHFSKTSSCSNQSFGDGGSPPKTWGSPLAFFDREIRRPGERGGWWWSSPRVTPTRWKSFSRDSQSSLTSVKRVVLHVVPSGAEFEPAHPRLCLPPPREQGPPGLLYSPPRCARPTQDPVKVDFTVICNSDMIQLTLH